MFISGVVRVDQIRGLNLPDKDLGFLGSPLSYRFID